MWDGQVNGCAIKRTAVISSMEPVLSRHELNEKTEDWVKSPM